MKRSIFERDNLEVIRENPLLVRCNDCGAEFLTANESFIHECDAKADSWLKARKHLGDRK